MNLVINEEQQMLKTSAKEYLKEKSPVEALRKLRDSNDTNGYDTQLWKEMAEMGWASLNIPEAYGGMDFGYVGFGQVLEEMGRTLVASPMVSTCLVGATLINLGGDVMQKETYLPQIADGSILLSLAMEEGNAHRPFAAATQFSQTEDGFSISGKKTFVLDGHVANHFIVTATDSHNNEITLFIIGTFQALQHRAAQMYCEIEICKSLVIKALQTIDTDSPMMPFMASMVKSKVGETSQLITNEAIQLFGGIGMTDDEEIGFFMKRARVAQQTFGDYNYHLDRFASMSGF